MTDEGQIPDDTIREKVERGRLIIGELAAILKGLPDPNVGDLLGTGSVDDLLKAILDPSTVKDYPNYAEFFLQNKTRSTILALMRYAITINLISEAVPPTG